MIPEGRYPWTRLWLLQGAGNSHNACEDDPRMVEWVDRYLERGGLDEVEAEIRRQNATTWD